jgi:hypothetical protein
MLWQIWVQPNRIIEEEYPNGWTRDEVFEAASNRWADKVTTVNPAPVGGSSSDDNSSSSSGGFGGSMDEGGFGILCALILGGWLLITFWPVILILGALGLFAWVYKVVKEED